MKRVTLLVFTFTILGISPQTFGMNFSTFWSRLRVKVKPHASLAALSTATGHAAYTESNSPAQASATSEPPRQSYKPALYFDWQGRVPRQPTMRDAFYRDIADNRYQNHLIPARTPNDKICRVATFNVHFWREGACGGKRMLSIRHTALGKIAADILTLQEVSFRRGCSAPELYYKLRCLGYHFQDRDIHKHYWLGSQELANLTVARTLPVTISAHDFTEPALLRQRGFVRTEIDLKSLGAAHSQHLVVYGTHLDVYDPTDTTRLAEMREIIHQAQADRAQGKLVIIAGDMNAIDIEDYNIKINNDKGELLRDQVIKNYKKYAGIEPESRLTKLVKESGFVDCFTKANTPGPLWTCLPGTRIDRIFVNKEWDLPITCYVYFTQESDHLPVIMDIRLPQK